MTDQNKIIGSSIANAAVTWDNETNGYEFTGDNMLNISAGEDFMDQNGISDDDLFDCIDQIEDEYGSPERFRRTFGVPENGGYLNTGTTVISRLNPAISCVFTPTSNEEEGVDAYLDWYFNANAVAIDDLTGYLKRFSDLSGAKVDNVLPSPIMPSYQEAAERMHSLKNISEASKEAFLRDVWNHQQTKMKGFKNSLAETLLPQWIEMQKRG